VIPVIVAVVLLAGVVLFCVFAAAVQREEFRQKFPLVSEEEFVAACPQGTDPVIALRVRAIVSEQLGVDYSRLHPAMRFVEDLGA
jgi:hypothetical protein